MLLRDFINGVYERKRLFVILIAISVVICSLKLNRSESYTSEIVIKYIGSKAEDGLTENGEKINPYEINSSLVVKNAVSTLGFNSGNIEEIRRNIVVEPIEPTAEQEKYASWISKFSDYEKNEDEKKRTVYYSVKYTTPKGNDYAKQVLSAVISQYRLYYVENYTYSYDITMLSGEAAMQYDYYETAELLKKKTDSNIEYLTNIASSDTDYHSPETGYSLLDLAVEYKSLAEQDLSVAQRMIIESGITRDPYYLKNTLQNKIKSLSDDAELYQKKSDTQKELMKVYSDKNKQYLWDRNTQGSGESESESSQVRGDVERDDYYSQNKSVYDNLVLDYVKYRTNALNSEIDRQLYENDAGSFSSEALNSALQPELEKKLKTACDRFNDLYLLTKDTIDDYNAYKSAKSIACISGVVSHKTVSTVFYYGVSLVIAIMLGLLICGAAVYIEKNENAGE